MTNILFVWSKRLRLVGTSYSAAGDQRDDRISWKSSNPAVASVTEGLAKFETVKKIALLEKELSVDGGELTPTMKMKRRVIDTKYKDVIDKMYAAAENEKPAE